MVVSVRTDQDLVIASGPPRAAPGVNLLRLWLATRGGFVWILSSVLDLVDLVGGPFDPACNSGTASGGCADPAPSRPSGM